MAEDKVADDTTDSPPTPARRRAARLAAAVALVLALPLVGLAYRLGIPGLAALFKENPIRAFMVVSPEGPARSLPELAMPAANVSGKGGGPEDSTTMIRLDAAPHPQPPAPTPPRQPQTSAPKPLVPAQKRLQAQEPPAPPSKPQWPRLKAKSFKQREAERQPTMFLMNIGPQDAAPSQARQVVITQPAQPAQVAAPAPAPPPTAVEVKPAPQAPPKKKVEPISRVPRRRNNNPEANQTAATPQTRIGPAEPVRFQDHSPGPAFPSGSGPAAAQSVSGHTTMIGPPDIAPKPNPLTSGAGPAPPKPIPPYPPGQAP